MGLPEMTSRSDERARRLLEAEYGYGAGEPEPQGFIGRWLRSQRNRGEALARGGDKPVGQRTWDWLHGVPVAGPFTHASVNWAGGEPFMSPKVAGNYALGAVEAIPFAAGFRSAPALRSLVGDTEGAALEKIGRSSYATLMGMFPGASGVTSTLPRTADHLLRQEIAAEAAYPAARQAFEAAAAAYPETFRRAVAFSKEMQPRFRGERGMRDNRGRLMSYEEQRLRELQRALPIPEAPARPRSSIAESDLLWRARPHGLPQDFAPEQVAAHARYLGHLIDKRANPAWAAVPAGLMAAPGVDWDDDTVKHYAAAPFRHMAPAPLTPYYADRANSAYDVNEPMARKAINRRNINAIGSGVAAVGVPLQLLGTGVMAYETPMLAWATVPAGLGAAAQLGSAAATMYDNARFWNDILQGYTKESIDRGFTSGSGGAE